MLKITWHPQNEKKKNTHNRFHYEATIVYKKETRNIWLGKEDDFEINIYI